MLKSLRNKTLMKIVMWSLVVIFAAWGLGSVAISRKSYPGIIFNKKVSMQEYNDSYNAVLNRAKMVYGDKLPKLEKFLDLKNQAWDRLILLHAASKKHIRASNKEVIERIAGFPFFQQNGQFNPGLYDYIVTNVFQTTPRDFEESVRGDIIIDKLISAEVEEPALTEEEIEKAYKAENELANASFILVSPEKYKEQVSIGEPEIRSFYNSRREAFLRPAYVNVAYLQVPFNDDKEGARFTADEIALEIENGKTLKGAAEEYGLELKETGNFSINSAIPEIGLSYPFTLTAFRLKDGQISEVVETADSFCIMRLKSKTPPLPLSYEEAKEKARALLINEKALSLAKSKAEDILSRIRSGGLTLEDIADEPGYELLTAKDISRKGYIKEIGPSEEFCRVAFSLNEGENGGPVQTQKGYAVIRTNSIKPVDMDRFQEEKESFSEKLEKEKRQKALRDWLTALKKKAALQDRLSS